MKKITALLLVLVMVLALTACGESKEINPDAVGVYTLKSITENEETQDLEEMGVAELMAATFSLVLNEDGTGTMLIDGETYTIKWNIDHIYLDGDKTDYTLEGDILTITDNNKTMVWRHT